MAYKRTRIIDIADELGLSTATVSNVIHGKTKKISDETVKRVQELLEQKQYIPSMAGILLGQNDSRIIGVVVNDHHKYNHRTLEDPFIASALNDLLAEVDKAGYFMMVKKTVDCNEIIRFASMWNMVGLVVIGFCEQDYKELREFMHIPFVVYDGFFAGCTQVCNIVANHFDGGLQAGMHLKQLGHSKALCISDNDTCMDLERYNGFKAAMGSDAVDLMIIPTDKIERRSFYRRKIEVLKKYTAVFAVSDYYAVDLMQFLQECSIKVPQDISVVGFDDSPLCDMACPPLTSVKQDAEKRAELAVSSLKKLSGGECGTTLTLPVSLVVRKSSASPALSK